MKQRLKQITKFMAICTMMVLASCEKDLYEEGIIANSNVIIKKVSLKDAFARNDFKLMTAVNELSDKQKNLASRMVYDSIYNFYYDDENGKYIEDGDKKSYTFPVIRNYQESKLENIVFNLKENGEYETYLTKYNLSEEEKLKLLNEQFIQINSNQVEFEQLNRINGLDCFELHSMPITWNEHGQVIESLFYLVPIECPDTGSGSNGEESTTGGSTTGAGTNPYYGNGGYPGGTPEGSTTNPTGTGSNTGPNGGSGGGTPIITTPVPCILCPSQGENIPIDPNKPCAKLAKMADPSDQNIYDDIEFLKNKVRNNTPIEWGVDFTKKVPSSINLELPTIFGSTQIQGDSDGVNTTFSSSNVAAAHLHTDKGFSIFSWADVRNLLLAHQNVNYNIKSDVTSFLVVKNPSSPSNPTVYAIKIDNYNLLNSVISGDLANPIYAAPTLDKKIENIHFAMGNFYAAVPNKEIAFLQRFSSYGISLYKATDNDLSNWAKLEIDGASLTGVRAIPCLFQ